MINFIVGRPGGGKTLITVRLIIQELRLTKRFICTNVPLKLPDMAEYLNEEFGETFDLVNRIRLLESNECFEFWRFPGPGMEITGRQKIGVRELKSGKVEFDRPDFNGLFELPDYPGTVFIIDECHEFFSSRGWAQTGPDFLYYCSQHRKLRHDVLFVTQNVSNVEKQALSVAQDFTYVRNLTNERLGIFGGVARILEQKFLSIPGPGSSPMATTVQKIDVRGLCKCYDTAAGVGITGRSADVGIKRKNGLPIWMGVVGLILFAWALWAGPNLLGRRLINQLGHARVDARSVTNHSLAAWSGGATVGDKAVSPGAAPVVASSAAPATFETTNTVVEAAPPALYLVGEVRLDGQYHLWFSDGTDMRTPDFDIGEVTTRYVIIRRDGRWRKVGWAPHTSQSASPQINAVRGTALLGGTVMTERKPGP